MPLIPSSCRHSVRCRRSRRRGFSAIKSSWQCPAVYRGFRLHGSRSFGPRSRRRRRQGVGEAGRRIRGRARGGDGRISRQGCASPAVLPRAPDQREEGIAERDHPAGRAMRGTKGRARIGGARAPRRAHAGEARPLHPVGNGAGGGALGAGGGSPDESSSYCRDDEPLDSGHDAPPGLACRVGLHGSCPTILHPSHWHYPRAGSRRRVHGRS
jgi:hypothetical protein